MLISYSFPNSSTEIFRFFYTFGQTSSLLQSHLMLILLNYTDNFIANDIETLLFRIASQVNFNYLCIINLFRFPLNHKLTDSQILSEQLLLLVSICFYLFLLSFIHIKLLDYLLPDPSWTQALTICFYLFLFILNY